MSSLVTPAYPGRLIVIDGVGGTGKSLQVQRVAEALQLKGYICVIESFPRYDAQPMGPVIRDYQTGKFGDPSEISPYLASPLYTIDREQASSRLKENLLKGTIVISARYISSNLAYQSAKLSDGVEQAAYREWLLHLEHHVLGIPAPDLVLFQYLPQEASTRLTERRATAGGEGADGHEQNADYLGSVIGTYRNLCDVYPNWRALDVSCASESGIKLPEVITVQLLEVIQPILPALA